MGDDILDVVEWIKYSQEDYDCALEIVKANNPYAPRHVCYMCHQSAEKILKAYTIAKDGTRIKDHDLTKLLKQCMQHYADFSGLKAVCLMLDTLITDARYPSGKKLTETDMNEAMKHAHEILEFTKAKLKAMGYEYTP